MNPPRNFSLLDAMLLVAATAPGALLWKEFLRCRVALPYLVSEEHAGSKIEPWAWTCGLVPGLSILTVVLLVVRLRSRGPRPRRTLLAPGSVPGLVSALGCVVVLAQACLDWSAIRRTHFGGFGQLDPLGLVTLRLVGMKDLVGMGVAAEWATLLVGGGWRPVGDWIDRAGRRIGLLWIALGLSSWVVGRLD